VKKQKTPKEDPSVIAFRERQIRELAEADEEENLRIKRALFPQARAFRRRSGDSSGGSTSPSPIRSRAGRTGRAAISTVHP
jgi:hypothetical protein